MADDPRSPAAGRCLAPHTQPDRVPEPEPRMAKMARCRWSPRSRIDYMLIDVETVQASASATCTAMPVTALSAVVHRILVATGSRLAGSTEYMELFGLAERCRKLGRGRLR